MIHEENPDPKPGENEVLCLGSYPLNISEILKNDVLQANGSIVLQSNLEGLWHLVGVGSEMFGNPSLSAVLTPMKPKPSTMSRPSGFPLYRTYLALKYVDKYMLYSFTSPCFFFRRQKAFEFFSPQEKEESTYHILSLERQAA